MRTPKQTAASRANGALSRGPVSIQGKLNSSRNSLRHGLLARTVVLEEESTHRFLELLQALIAEFQPASTTQFMLVETMAVARWRQLRVWGMHKVIMDREIALQDPALGTPEVRAGLAFKSTSETVQPDLILRYDIALERQFSRSLARLLDLQSRPAPKTSEPFFPASLPTHTWKDPQNDSSLQSRDPSQQRRDPSSKKSEPTKPETDPEQRPISKRTQQPLDSTRSLHPVPPPNPAPDTLDTDLFEPFDLHLFE